MSIQFTYHTSLGVPIRLL